MDPTIFNVLVALGLPWLIYDIQNLDEKIEQPIKLGAMPKVIGLTIAVSLWNLGTIWYCGWKLPFWLGMVNIGLWVTYVALELIGYSQGWTGFTA